LFGRRARRRGTIFSLYCRLIAATPVEAPGGQNGGPMKTLVRPLDIVLLVCSHVDTRFLQRLVFVILKRRRRNAHLDPLVGSRWRIWQRRQAPELSHRMSPACLVVCTNDKESRPAVVLHQVLQSAPTQYGASARRILSRTCGTDHYTMYLV
ncbi:hypothetical protein QBC39DRAFT_415670, partial [Podospora conica]